jgi:3-isopropylmalate/(R)-2-methylmalate dehydratase small subunit
LPAGTSAADLAQTIALKEVGVGTVVAKSFARIFYRNTISLRPPVVKLQDTSEFEQGDVLETSLEDGELRNATRSTLHEFRPLPEFLMEALLARGLIPYLNEKLATWKSEAKHS